MEKDYSEFVGKAFGDLTIQSIGEFRDGNTLRNGKIRKYITVNCLCKCGKNHNARLDDLRYNSQKSCGCSKIQIDTESNKRKADLSSYINKKYNHLKILEFVEFSGATKIPYFMCLCDCGTRKKISLFSMLYEKTKSCGCFADAEKRKRKLPNGENPLRNLFCSYRSSAAQRGCEFLLSFGTGHEAKEQK